MTCKPFEPYGNTQNVAMDGAAKSTTITGVSDAAGTVRLVNVGTQTIFVRLDGTTAALATGFPLLANTIETFSIPTGQSTVKSIGAAGSTLYVTVGRGV